MQEVRYFAVTELHRLGGRSANRNAMPDKPDHDEPAKLPPVWWFLPSVTLGLCFWLLLRLLFWG